MYCELSRVVLILVAKYHHFTLATLAVHITTKKSVLWRQIQSYYKNNLFLPYTYSIFSWKIFLICHSGAEILWYVLKQCDLLNRLCHVFFYIMKNFKKANTCVLILSWWLEALHFCLHISVSHQGQELIGRNLLYEIIVFQKKGGLTWERVTCMDRMVFKCPWDQWIFLKT